MIMISDDQTNSDEGLVSSRDFSGLLVEERTYFESHSDKHAHEDAILCIVLQGSCAETYAGKTREYRVFDSEFLPPEHEHSLTFNSPLTRCLNLQIDKSWLQRVQEFGFKLGPAVHLRNV